MATPTFQLLELKALPEFKTYFGRLLKLGEYSGHPTRQFRFSEAGCKRTFGHVPETPTRVLFGHAADPDSLESSTAKGAWLDEAGQNKFKAGSWEAIQRRLSLHQGRVLITTTPYNVGWLKQRLWDPWEAAHGKHPYIDVIRFDSIENPAFPREEFERARATLPPWKFSLFYRGLFSRPPGLIYDCFDDKLHKCPRFSIPKSWDRYMGIDFGGVHTAALFIAQEPETNRLYVYREYMAGQRTAKEHADALLAGEPGLPTAVGGAKSEDQWRDEFAAAGLPIRAPEISDVEVGIDRVYGALKRNEVLVFDDLAGFLEELVTYSRKLDDAGEPTEEIENKADFHFADSARYVLGWLKDAGPWEPSFGPPLSIASAPAGLGFDAPYGRDGDGEYAPRDD